MFCHKCGKKLVSGARFCSWCSTPVPEEIWAEMNRFHAADSSLVPVSVPIPAPVSEPVPESEPEPEPKSESLPDPAPVSEPKSEPVSMPQPVPASEPEPAPKAESASVSGTQPVPVPAPVLSPGSIPVPGPDPVPEPEPIPKSVSEPDPVSGSEPKSETEPTSIVTPVPEPVKETVTLFLKVTREQVMRGDTVILEHEALLEPMRLTLRQNMQTGSRLRLTNAKMKLAPSGRNQELLVVIKILSDSKTKPKAIPDTSISAPSPAPAKAVAPINPAPAGRSVSFTPVVMNYGYQLCNEGDLKTGFKLYGADDTGVVEVAPSGITLYKKSKVVVAAFGLIGSMIEGKGKLVAVIRPIDISSFEKEQKNRKLYEYRIHLKDHRILKLNVAGSKVENVLYALDLFLSQAGG